MSNEKQTTVTGGVGVTGLLLIAFIILKLCGVIKWSWLWVLAPAWIPLGLCMAGVGILALIDTIRLNKKRKNARKQSNK